VRVAYGTSSVSVIATPEDSNATVSIKGANRLGSGNNIVTITVTAQDTKTIYEYVITIITNKMISHLSNFTIPKKIYEFTRIQLIDPSSNNTTGSFSYTSSNTDIATINGNTLTIVGIGIVTITATQNETDDFLSNTISTTFDTSKINFPKITDFLQNKIIGIAEPNSTIVVNNKNTTTQIQSNSEGIWNYEITDPSNFYSFSPINTNKFSTTIQNVNHIKYPKKSYTLTTNTPVLIKAHETKTIENDTRLWKISPSLPNGLKFSKLTGTIVGSPVSTTGPIIYTVWSNSEIFVSSKTQITIEIVSSQNTP
jgi:hypothetical protein